ncbi:MAG: PorT family protein [Bacteroidetes bacterium]|nr:PorT family protein [Bacteroidota bacterium]
MKKLSILLILFCFIFGGKSVFAQGENELKNFRFGLKAQPSLGWYKPEDIKKYTSGGTKMKFGYGLITEFRLSKVAAFQTGLEINSSGGIIDYADTTYSIPEVDTFFLKTRSYGVNYIDIPISLKLKSAEIGSITYWGQFGVNASIRWKGKATDTGHFVGTTTETDQANLDVSKDLNLIQLGLNVGIGIEYNLAGSTSLLVGVNYHNGFTNIMSSESKLLMDKNFVKIKQNTKANFVSLTVGVLF